ncbi:MAG TPA: GntR family transcriptional regulator [Spirochaetia bacterium]|jgi:DNA-binding transcriptional regulator YhcF (GntR family)|nr:GntR family transcriptional regulator [Spirochaetia bacterium]
MEFPDKDPIYLQISRLLSERILTGEWKPGDRVPSVRDLATDLEVNPNTVARTFQLLQDAGVFENRRGVGSFVAEGARDLVVAQARDRMENQDLPRVFQALAALGISPGHLSRLYETYLSQTKENLP